jgi:hypothetical protein
MLALGMHFGKTEHLHIPHPQIESLSECRNEGRTTTEVFHRIKPEVCIKSNLCTANIAPILKYNATGSRKVNCSKNNCLKNCSKLININGF